MTEHHKTPTRFSELTPSLENTQLSSSKEPYLEEPCSENLNIKRKPKLIIIKTNKLTKNGSKPIIVTPLSFDAEMQQRGLKERIKSIESLNTFLEFELGSNYREENRNSLLNRNVSASSTKATVQQVTSKEVGPTYLQSHMHIRSNSNALSQNCYNPPNKGKCIPAKITFPYQRRLIRIEESTIDSKHTHDKVGVKPKQHPMSPRTHLKLLTLRLNERGSQELNANCVQAYVVEGIKSLPTSPKGIRHSVTEGNSDSNRSIYINASHPLNIKKTFKFNL